jgi:hypothetical protein
MSRADGGVIDHTAGVLAKFNDPRFQRLTGIEIRSDRVSLCGLCTPQASIVGVGCRALLSIACRVRLCPRFQGEASASCGVAQAIEGTPSKG